MKDRECVKCEKVLECEGKPTANPCLHYKERKENGKDKQQTERRKV